jgi:hypothetical protein
MNRSVVVFVLVLSVAGCQGQSSQPSPSAGQPDANVPDGKSADAAALDVDAKVTDGMDLAPAMQNDGSAVETQGEAAPPDARVAVDTGMPPDSLEAKDADFTRWIVDNTESIGGLPVTVSGSPTLTDMPQGKAVCFGGTGDRLVVPQNPIAGLARFTVEVLFRPDGNGPAEQRMVHMQDDAADGNRAMMETRVVGTQWYLDTYLTSGASSLTLIDSAAKHATDVWYWASLTYDGNTMRHFVAGVEDKSGALSFKPIGKGRTGLGMRLNNISPFKGCIRELRVHPRALPVTELQAKAP